jgi:signal transduction histidine kinase/ActR/RegA family two-component response regulator
MAGEVAAARAVLDSLPTFVAIVAPGGSVRFVNAAPLAAADCSLDELVGVPLWLTPWWKDDASAQDRIRSACDRAAAGEAVYLDLPMRAAPKGSTTPAEIDIVPQRDRAGRVRRLVVSAVNAARTQPATSHGTVAADRRTDEFLAMLAHELRNPLAPLRHAASMLRLTDEGNPRRMAIGSLVDRQVRHMSRLLDSLLDASRIAQGKITLELEPIELVGLVTQVLEAARPTTEARGQQVLLSAPDAELWTRGDAVRIAQIVENLVTNATKFTNAEGIIRVNLRADRHDAILSVADNGHGIEPELLPRVFDLFMQGPRSLDRNQGGLGIGLSLVRNLTALHGGTVTAISPGIGKGSEFIVTLPLCLREPAAAAGTPDASSFVPRRVLVVDDNIDAAESLAELLAMKGHQTRASTDSRAALKLAGSFAPEVVLLDIGLPEIDGYQVARRLRKMPATRNALVVAVTGYGQPEDRRASKAAGFDYHLVKPVGLQQLEELIEATSHEPSGT